MTGRANGAAGLIRAAILSAGVLAAPTTLRSQPLAPGAAPDAMSTPVAPPPVASPPVARPLEGAAGIPAASDPEGISTDCGSGAGRYAGPKGLTLWVTRKGTLLQDNPLRPLTKDNFVLLQLVVNGRVASAFGPDFAHMQRAGPPEDIEPSVPKTIAWDARADALPRVIRVVGDDGTELLAPITFSTCGEPPKVAVRDAKRPRKPQPAADRRPPGMKLPQGAIP